MKNKKNSLALILVFVLLIGGAYVLYESLGRNTGAQQLLVHAETPPENAKETDATAPEADDSTPSTAQEAPDTEKTQVIYAPDFTAYDKDGNAVNLSEYFGKPIVLNFWASWCGPCRQEMPAFNEKYKELGQSVHFVMVNMTDGGRETVETAQKYIEDNGYAFEPLFDTSSHAAMTYGAYSLPTTFFINKDGHVIAQAVGAINAETLETGIDMITD